MNIRKWQKPGTEEVRYYIDLRFGPAPFLPRDANRLLDGRWIARGDDGMAHTYTKTESGRGVCRSQDGEWLDQALLGHAAITFDAWEQTYQACLTAGGNFSVARYMKL